MDNFPKGVCTQMCPENEIIKREKERLLHIFEIDPSTKNTKHPKANKNRCVKEFSRSAAGRNSQNVTELRTFDTILRTIYYLLHDIVLIDNESWITKYDFIMDRVRAIRQDMVIQSFPRNNCISILQPIVRFYAYSAYRMCEEPISIFDPVINNNHLQECLKRMLSYYSEYDHLVDTFLERVDETGDRIRENELCSIGRPYMEALYLIFNLGNIESMQRYLKVPKIYRHYFVDDCFQISLEYWRGNVIRVCRLIKKLPIFLGMVAVLHLPKIRRRAFAIMSAAYNSKELLFPLNILQELFLYNNINEVLKECEYYNITVKESGVLFQSKSFDNSKQPMQPRHINFIDEALSDINISDLMLHAEMIY